MAALSESVNELLAIVQEVEAVEAHARDLRGQIDQKYVQIKAQIDSSKSVQTEIPTAQ